MNYSKKNLKGLSRDELGRFIRDLDEKSFRVKQIWSWMYQKGVLSFDEMTNLSRSFRDRLDHEGYLSSLILADSLLSKKSGTTKFVWTLHDGLQVESVFIPEQKRRTICISTQVGCPLGCTFCATGKMGWIRNLSTAEIVDQILCVRRETGIQPTNIVLMGMGEPFLNYDKVIKALYIVNDPEGISIGHRKITISTSGLVPQLLRYTKEKHPFKLAISLNSTTNEQRNRIMPVNRRYPLESLLDAARQYCRALRKRITFEYVMLKDFNDRPEDARRLIKLLRNIPCKVNLIAYNTAMGTFKRPSDEHIKQFADQISPLSAPVTLRLSKGDDIRAACGQLVRPGHPPSVKPQ